MPHGNKRSFILPIVLLIPLIALLLFAAGDVAEVLIPGKPLLLLALLLPLLAAVAEVMARPPAVAVEAAPEAAAAHPPSFTSRMARRLFWGLLSIPTAR